MLSASRAASSVSRPSVPARGGALACRAQAQARSLAERASLAAATVALSAGVVAAPAFAGAGVEFSNVKSGTTVQSPVHLEFTVDGMSVKPASEGLVPNTGHFHVLIDEAGAWPEGDAIPFDDAHKHYGKGQLVDDVALTPGTHKLTLQFANAKHESYGDKFAKTITVNVK